MEEQSMYPLQMSYFRKYFTGLEPSLCEKLQPYLAGLGNSPFQYMPGKDGIQFHCDMTLYEQLVFRMQTSTHQKNQQFLLSLKIRLEKCKKEHEEINNSEQQKFVQSLLMILKLINLNQRSKTYSRRTIFSM